MGIIGISYSDFLSRFRWMIFWKVWMLDDWGRKGKRVSCVCVIYLRVGRGCYFLYFGFKLRVRGRLVKRIFREMWVSRDFCLFKFIYIFFGVLGRYVIRIFRVVLFVKYYFLGFCFECICILDKRLVFYILGKDYWRRAVIFIRDYRDFIEKVNYGSEGRFYFFLFWVLKVGFGFYSWDIRGVFVTWRYWEILKEILKIRWFCGF